MHATISTTATPVAHVRGYIACPARLLNVRDHVVTEVGPVKMITSVTRAGDHVDVAWVDRACMVGEASWTPHQLVGMVMTAAAYIEHVRMVDPENGRLLDQAIAREQAETPRCSACIEHPGWAHGDESQRREPADVCRACFGSGVEQVSA